MTSSCYRKPKKHKSTLIYYLKSMGVDHGGTDGGQVPQNLEREDCPPRFCHVAKFKAPDYLHYNVEKCVFASTAGLL